MAKDKDLNVVEALDITVAGAVTSSLLPTIPAPEEQPYSTELSPLKAATV